MFSLIDVSNSYKLNLNCSPDNCSPDYGDSSWGGPDPSCGPDNSCGPDFSSCSPDY